ncbi:MAG: fibronectin type III domain-containing protein [Phycisphaerales bacterium]
MGIQNRSLRATMVTLMGLVAGILAPSWALAIPPRDRTPPTTPANLRVTGVSDYSVTLTWDAASDDSGSFSYRLFSSAGISALVPQYYTSYTFTTHHTAGTSYSFYVFAQDGAGNRSANSNTTSATLLPEGTPPSAPVLSLEHAGPTHLTVSWTTPPDAGPTVHFFLFADGRLVLTASQQTSYTLYFAAPKTTHTFKVVARDGRVRYSAPSAMLTATTPGADPNDVTPPTQPTDVWAGGWGDLEFMASWSASADDVTAPEYIGYVVYLNGVFIGQTPGSRLWMTDYGVMGENTLEVIAIDEAGNESEPQTFVFSLP